MICQCQAPTRTIIKVESHEWISGRELSASVASDVARTNLFCRHSELAQPTLYRPLRGTEQTWNRQFCFELPAEHRTRATDSERLRKICTRLSNTFANLIANFNSLAACLRFSAAYSGLYGNWPKMGNPVFVHGNVIGRAGPEMWRTES